MRGKLAMGVSTPGGDLRILLESFPDNSIEFLARRGMAHPFDDFARERVDQHATGGVGSNPAGAQVKDGLLI